MTSRRNVNLNKELANDWVGRVRKWKRQWVPVDDKPPPGKKPCMLLKWVQTDERAHPGPSRHPHIVPVKDLSLVPGARVGPALDAIETAGLLVADPTAAPPLIDLSTQQAATPAAAAAVDAPLQPSAFAGALAAAAAEGPTVDAQTAAAAAEPAAAASDLAAAVAAAGLGPPTLSLEAAAAAAAGGLAGMPQPSLLAATASGLESLGLGGLSQPSSSQQLMMAEAPSVPAASDYTAGTDSEALGRLPHGGAAVSDYTAGTDSMDVDGAMGGAMSQGVASMRRADVDMAEEDELDDGLGDEEDEEPEEEDDEEDDDEDDDQQQHNDDDDGLEDDGLERGVIAAGDDDEDVEDPDDDNDEGVDEDDDEDVEDDMPG